jgi:hypothetical protein
MGRANERVSNNAAIIIRLPAPGKNRLAEIDYLRLLAV